MYDILSSQFNDAMSREGKTITSSTGKPYKCFFRKNSDKNQTNNRVTIYYWATEDIAQGQMIKYNNNYYIVLNRETVENDVYKKSDLLQVNTEIYTIAKASNSEGYELYIKAYAQDITSVGLTGNSKISVVGGNLELITEDNTDSRNLSIGSTFTALGGSWKIVNLYYKSGLCYIYVERYTPTATTPTYALSITANDTYNVDETGMFTATATVSDNAVTTTILNPTITWTSSDENIATITNDGMITAIAEGTVTITATWVEHGITATREITVKSNVVITYTAAITPTSKNIRTNSGYTFTGAFTDSTGATAPLTAVWSLTYEDSFMAPLVTLANQTDTSVRVNVANKDDLIGYTATLHLTDSNNLCSATAEIEIA